MRILYVEDHAVFASTVIEQFLSEHEVMIAASVAEALHAAAAAATTYDVVLVDYDLPDGKGTTVIEALRRSGYRGRIIATSSKEVGNIALRQAGAHATCQKTHMHRIAGVLIK